MKKEAYLISMMLGIFVLVFMIGFGYAESSESEQEKEDGIEVEVENEVEIEHEVEVENEVEVEHGVEIENEAENEGIEEEREVQDVNERARQEMLEALRQMERVEIRRNGLRNAGNNGFEIEMRRHRGGRDGIDRLMDDLRRGRG